MDDGATPLTYFDLDLEVADGSRWILVTNWEDCRGRDPSYRSCTVPKSLLTGFPYYMIAGQKYNVRIDVKNANGWSP